MEYSVEKTTITFRHSTVRRSEGLWSCRGIFVFLCVYCLVNTTAFSHGFQIGISGSSHHGGINTLASRGVYYSPSLRPIASAPNSDELRSTSFSFRPFPTTTVSRFVKSEVSAKSAAIRDVRETKTSEGISTLRRKRSLRTLGPEALSGKSVLLRSDLNVPLTKDGEVSNDARIKASMQTIDYLVGHGSKILLCSHLGRPHGFDQTCSLRHVKECVERYLGKDIQMADDCIGPEVSHKAAQLKCGDVLLLENVRFHPKETTNDETFAEALAANADLYVNDAFGAAHRAHASTEGVAKFLRPSVSGLLLEKELDYLSGALANPARPFVALIGGSKVSSKIGVLRALLDKVDVLILGGGMVFTFFKARGLNVGNSLVETANLDTARTLERLAAEKGVELVLPTDVVIADKFASDAQTRVVSVTNIPDGWWALDNGPQTTNLIKQKLQNCKTVLWNGPMGVAEFDRFAVGTNEVAKTVAELTKKNGAVTIVGGGDSVAAIEKAELGEFMSHVSTGGGASLELLEGKVLPGVAALDDAEVLA